MDVRVALALGPGFRSLLPALAAVDSYIQATTAHLVVCDLADRTLGGLATATTTLLKQIDPDATPPLADLAWAGAEPVDRLLLRRGHQLRLGAAARRILQIGSTDTGATIWFTALIDSAPRRRPRSPPTCPTSRSRTPSRSPMLTRVSRRPLACTPQQIGQFTLAGQMKLNSIFGSDYSLGITLTVYGTRPVSTVTPTTQSISDPFSIGGIVLSDLSLTVTYTWAVLVQGKPQTSSFTLGGHAAGHGQGAPSCATTLALVSGAPVLFDVALDADFSLGAFLAQCLTGEQGQLAGRLHRPRAAVRDAHLLLRPGRRRLRPVAQHAGRHHVPAGLQRRRADPPHPGHLDHAARRAHRPDDRRLHRRPGRDPDRQPARPGLRADREHHLARTGPALHPAARCSPSRPARSPNSYCASGSTSWDRRDQGLRRRHDHEGHADRGPAHWRRFGTLGCGFTYTSHPNSDGEFDGWPDFIWVRNLIDFVEAIKDLADTSGGSPCGTLGDFIVTTAYSSSFSVSPSASVSGTNLVFAVTGTYALTLIGASSPFVNVTMPAFSVPIPSTTRWGNMPEALATSFTTAARAVCPRPAEPAGQDRHIPGYGGRAAGGKGRARAGMQRAGRRGGGHGDRRDRRDRAALIRTTTLIVSMRARRLQREGWERRPVGT